MHVVRQTPYTTRLTNRGYKGAQMATPRQTPAKGKESKGTLCRACKDGNRTAWVGENPTPQASTEGTLHKEEDIAQEPTLVTATQQ